MWFIVLIVCSMSGEEGCTVARSQTPVAATEAECLNAGNAYAVRVAVQSGYGVPAKYRAFCAEGEEAAEKRYQEFSDRFGEIFGLQKS